MPGLQSLLKVVVGSALVWSSCRVMAGESDQSAAEATETVQRFNLDVPRIPLYGTISCQFVANDSQGET